MDPVPGVPVIVDQFLTGASILRASSSIVLNISEGYGRISKKDQRRFYSFAFGSTREVQSILDIIDEQRLDLIKTADNVAACLYCLLYPKK
ncbi:MAG: four helix bundle protein [Deltaproteobacteria bacterium]|nr:four helix bundle protein [Deltaproteobacteria bacterium]